MNCQRELSAHQGEASPRYVAWKAGGQPRIDAPAVKPARKPKVPKDVRLLPTAYLVQCAHELSRREREAQATIAALGKLRKP